MKQTDQKNKNSQKKQPKHWGRFVGFGVQMAVIIGLGSYSGVWLDDHYQLDKPLFTASLSIISIFIATYSILRDFIK